MVVEQTLYLILYFLAVTDEPLELCICSLMWRLMISIHESSVYFVLKTVKSEKL